ncbi:hypothetical protein GALMADRAFT_52449 [Galerina marginata CBS 339.88]|uniref:Uncharacterized protein n=1 Tax=Galerina marginata (strain CBS 339.88) TaxID=685588 RepID=A0A067TZA4_GALM3|nr:hypothetical protein GALMADRAFT_52449 [Galerina marginata CBS 339.88]
MSITPARGEVVLQPNYFTSSVYVNALRDDISTLVFRYHEAYSQSGCTKPFALFKAVWLNLGWNWLQFKVFDSRSRQTFLEVTLRLFLERAVKTEAPFTRAVALFGVYLFYYTQVKDTAPALYCLENIPIPCGTSCKLCIEDHYLSLIAMPESLTSPNVLPLQTHIRYILSCLKRDHVFFILPKSELYPMNPRELPREIYAENGGGLSDQTAQKRKGRPARREKGKKARQALESLDEWSLEDHAEQMNDAVADYEASKAVMLDEIPPGSVDSVTRVVVDGLKDVTGGDGAGIDVIAESGIFGLVGKKDLAETLGKRII